MITPYELSFDVVKGFRKQNSGFTTIELVVVILILGVLAVTAAPRFISQKSALSSSYQGQLFSALRLVQWQQMQLTSSDSCLTLSLSAIALKPQSVCATIPDGVSVEVDSSDQASVSFSSSASVISFDLNGLPASDCSGGCTITISDGDNSRRVEINSEGYIYAP